MSYIYNSRIANTGWHLKYRYNLLRALKEPENFKYIKDIWITINYIYFMIYLIFHTCLLKAALTDLAILFYSFFSSSLFVYYYYYGF